MFKKLAVVVLVVGLAMATGMALAAQGGTPTKPPAKGGGDANSCGWTNMKFAEFLAGNYGIKPSEDPKMSEADKYKALANALSEKGITYFSGASAGAKVSCCDTADTLYKVVGAQGEAGSCDLQINYLIQNGYLKAGDNPCSALCDIPTVFSGPIIEKFRPPRFPTPPTGPPERHDEVDVSTTGRGN